MNATQVLKIFRLTLIKIFLLSKKTNLYGQNTEFDNLVIAVTSLTIFMIRDIEHETNPSKVLETLREHANTLSQLNLANLSTVQTVSDFCLELLDALRDHVQLNCSYIVNPGKAGWFGYGATPPVQVNPLLDCINSAINYFAVEATAFSSETLTSAPILQQIEVNFALENYSQTKELIGEHLKDIKESCSPYIKATDATLARAILKVCLSHGATEKATREPTVNNIDDAEALVTLYQLQVDREMQLPFFAVSFEKMLDCITNLKSNFIISTIKNTLPHSRNYLNTIQLFINVIRDIFGVEAFRYSLLSHETETKQNFHDLPKQIFTYIENTKVKNLVSKNLLRLFDELLNMPISSPSDEYRLTQDDHDRVLKFKESFTDMEAYNKGRDLYKAQTKYFDPNLGKNRMSRKHY